MPRAILYLFSYPSENVDELVGEGFSISLIGITFPLYPYIGTLVVSRSVKQCISVDLFPHILANAKGGAPFVTYTIVEQNTQVILCENVCKTL